MKALPILLAFGFLACAWQPKMHRMGKATLMKVPPGVAYSVCDQICVREDNGGPCVGNHAACVIWSPVVIYYQDSDLTHEGCHLADGPDGDPKDCRNIP